MQRLFGPVLVAALGLVAASGCGDVDLGLKKTPDPGTSEHPLAMGQAHLFGPDGGDRLEVTPVKVERGRIQDLADYDLKAADKQMTPYYVWLRVRNAGKAPLKAASYGGGSHVRLNDAQGRPLKSLMLFSVFGDDKLKCQDHLSPANWRPGASLDSCTVFLGSPGATPTALAYSAAVMSFVVEKKQLTWWRVSVT